MGSQTTSVKRRISPWLLSVMVIVLAVIATFSKQLTQLYHTIRLFDQDVIVENFSSIPSIVDTVTIHRAGEIDPFGYELKPLPTHYDYFGESRSISEWIKESNTTALLVLHNDNILYEQYYQGTTDQDLRISWSVAKSFLSALMGVAVAEGDIKDLDALVTDYVPELAGTGYDGVTIKHVLHMSSGVEFNEDYGDFYSDINRLGRVLALGGSFDEFAASLNNGEQPGVKMHYVSIDTHVLGMVLRAATGKPIKEYFYDKLWQHIGAEREVKYIVDSTGQPMVLGGLNVITRDYARMGRLFRDGGFANGKQIISKDWVEKSTTAEFEYLRPSMNKGQPTHLGYGYQWWLPHDADNEFMALGIYGQFIYVNKHLNVVIVKNSADTHFMENNKESRVKAIEAFRSIAKQMVTGK